MHEGQYLITFLHPLHLPIMKWSIDWLKRSYRTYVRAVFLEFPSSKHGRAYLHEYMRGVQGMLMAANYLPKFVPQIFTATV